jgi:signal transduction histidine kinase
MIWCGAIFCIASTVMAYNLTRATARLEAEQQNKYKILSRVSHELRTPCLGVTGAASMLQAAASDLSADHARLVSIIQEQAKHLTRLVDDIMTLACHQGRWMLREQKFDLRALVTNLHAIVISAPSLHSTLATSHHSQTMPSITFDFHVDDSVPQYAFGDDAKIQQILVNFISNAFKFSPKGGSVILNVSMTDNNKSIKFSVQDEGVGMNTSQVSTLFTPFSQGGHDGAERWHHGSKKTGLGLGMTIATELATLMVRIVSPSWRSVFERILNDGLPCRTPK